MGFLRKLFGQRKATPAKAEPTARVAAPRALVRRAPGDIHDKLQEIASSTTPEEAFGPALQTVIDALGAEAAALCLYDPERSVMKLAAEIGISDEGCRQLRTAKDGVPLGWDMPLHSLINRRAYLIDSAARNRYVPRLVKNSGAVGTVACLPIVTDTVPLASLVIVTMAPRHLDEKDVLALQPALRDLAMLIVTLRRNAPDATSWRPPPSLRVQQGGGGRSTH